MKNTGPKRHANFFAVIASCLALFAGVSANDAAAAEPLADAPADGNQADHQRVVIAPYGWAMAVSGTVGINGLAVPLNLQSTELLRGVKSGGMGYLLVPVGNHFVYLESLGVSFGQSNFQPLFNQSVDADLFFAETGFGWNIPLDTGFAGEGRTTVSPYLGVRTVDLRVKVNGPLLVQSIKKDWHDPALGIIIQGPVWRRLGYAVKLDAAGFNTDGDNYHSVLVVLRYTFDPSWSVAAGYRISQFKAQSNSANGLALDLSGFGPLVGIQYSF